jgi:hypothetical protein
MAVLSQMAQSPVLSPLVCLCHICGISSLFAKSIYIVYTTKFLVNTHIYSHFTSGNGKEVRGTENSRMAEQAGVFNSH